MNDEWSRCPICFEDYSLEHRPTTFHCGHSTCIDHTIGVRRLQNCPICRHPLEAGRQYQVSYNLEEASRLFQAIKNTIDWSTVKLPSTLTDNNIDNSTTQMIHRDEIYARQLQARLNQEMGNTSQRRERIHEANQQLQVNAATNIQSQPAGYEKTCGHRCDLRTTPQCCTCSDRRPRRQGNTYEAYVDGRGTVNRAARNEFYCPTCKRQ